MGSLKAIGRAFGKSSSSIYFLVAPHGGIGRLKQAGSISDAEYARLRARLMQAEG